MDHASLSHSDQHSVPQHFGGEEGAAAVLGALASAASHNHEREVLQELTTSALANVQILPGATAPSDVAAALGRSLAARHRLMARSAQRAFVPVLIAFAAEQVRVAASISADLPQPVAASIRLRAEVLRGLAATSRQRYSGNFRAAVFGANDGLVSNLALVVGMSATGVSASIVLAAGLAGLLAGALSMAAGEYISVRSARELLHGSRLNAEAVSALASQGAHREHIALIYRARGMRHEQAVAEAETLDSTGQAPAGAAASTPEESQADQVVGTASGAAISSFFFFASGALIPILPYLFGLPATAAMLLAVVLVGAALLATGATVGLLSGASPMRKALRQLTIGYGAAAATYLLGLVFGAVG
ncbi:MAG: VIT1/CCC1 transporter family protein [Ornithinimicrobium sp.]